MGRLSRCHICKPDLLLCLGQFEQTLLPAVVGLHAQMIGLTPFPHTQAAVPEYSAAPEPGVRRMRATIPVRQRQCSGQREPVSFPLLLSIVSAELGMATGVLRVAAMPLFFVLRVVYFLFSPAA